MKIHPCNLQATPVDDASRQCLELETAEITMRGNYIEGNIPTG
ncbi:MAG: hypothetical protein ACTHM7_10155 [Ginsengibacter sp.]